MKYMGWVMGESRNPVTPFGQQLAVGVPMRFPDRTSSLCLRTTSRAQGWRIGLLRSATRSVGCEIGWRALSHRWKARTGGQAEHADENAGREVPSVFEHRLLLCDVSESNYTDPYG